MASYSGSAGNDQYFGTPEADRILGHQGQDQLRGAAGDDYLSGGSGPDTLYGDQGDDRIEGDSGDDVVRGGRGADTISGGAGTDVLFGDRDDDELSGDEGDDVLFGGPGDDTFHGGAGSDIVHGGPGTDTVDYGSSPVRRPGSGADYDLVVALHSHDPQRGGHAEGDLLLDVENVLGSPGNDLIAGSPAAVNHLDGRGGDDRLVLYQGGTLVGGPGDDTFVFAHEGLATAEIRDFTKGEDKIALEFGFFDDDLNYVEVDESRLEALLRGSEGNVLYFSQLGPEFEGFGNVTLNVGVSTLDTSDFLLP